MNRPLKATLWIGLTFVLTFLMAFVACGCASVTGARTEMRSDKTATYYEKGKRVRIIISTTAPVVAKEARK